jgi:hypothetical protein
VFFLIKMVEPLREAVLRLYRDRHNFCRLSLPASAHDKIRTGSVPVVPSGLNKDAPCVRVAGFALCANNY